MLYLKQGNECSESEEDAMEEDTACVAMDTILNGMYTTYYGHPDVAYTELFILIYMCFSPYGPEKYIGVVAYIDVRTANANMTATMTTKMESMGAQVQSAFNNKVTHLVCRKRRKTY